MALREEGLTPIGETQPDDIFIVGYPKSGNTWFQIMASVLLFGASVEATPFTLIREMVPDLSERKYYLRHSRRMAFKSHALPNEKFKRVVYLLRDGRDVMVSYRHYRQIVDKCAYGSEQFVSADQSLWPCHWADHVRAWSENCFGAELIFIRYEDLVKNTARELRRFCDFAALRNEDLELTMVAAATSMERLQEKEVSEGNWHPAFSKSDKFFRRGEIGSHRDEMPPEALERLLSHAGPVLRQHGYL